MNTYLETFDLRVETIAQGGDAVGRREGRVIFVGGALPGELVQVGIYEQRAAYARGRALAVLEPSPERVAPRLPGAGHMPWQHIAYPAQLRFKEQILREQLARLAGLADPPLRPMIEAERPWGYRNSARLHSDGVRLGYHAPESRDVLDLVEDPLLLPGLNQALAGLRVVLEQGAQRAASGLTAVLLRASEAYGYLIAALEGGNVPALETLARRWMAVVPSLAGVDLPGRPGAAYLFEEFGRLVFALRVESFFQVHTAQAERLLELVHEGLALRRGERLLDAYGGVGAFGLPLAGGLREVVVIEESPLAVADGEWSAALNQIGNVRFICGAVERRLPELGGRIDAAILDPPRRGCHPAALQALIAFAPPRIAYISCHPAILARDLGPLLAAGYRLRSVQPVDLFPQTPHIESLALLEH